MDNDLLIKNEEYHKLIIKNRNFLSKMKIHDICCLATEKYIHNLYDLKLVFKNV